MGSWLPIGISLVALGLTMYNLYRDRSVKHEEGTRGYNASWNVFNQILVCDPEFVDIERDLHPFGSLSSEEMKRVYFWFMRFNVTYSAYRSSNNKFMSNKLGLSSLANEANLSYRDQEFIRKHVFSRGYDKGYTDTIILLWDEISDRGKTLPMLGDENEEYVTTINLHTKPRPKRRRKTNLGN